MEKKLRLLMILFLSVTFLHAQGNLLQYSGGGSYIYIERTDLRRYDNGKYVGLVSREIRSFINPVGGPAGADLSDRYFDGNFYVAEGTKRANASVGAELNGSIPSTFKITKDGQLIMIHDEGYPTFRSFPAYTRQRINIGDRWQAKAERIVDPLNKGVKTKIPIYVEYTYLRDDSFHGEDVFVISAQWATRYGLAATLDFGGDRELKFSQGSHKANILVSKKTGNALVVRDTVDEEFQYSDGNRYAFKGTISMFTEYPPSYDRSKLFPALQRIASISKEELKDIMEKPVNEALPFVSKANADDKKREAIGEKVKTNGSSVATAKGSSSSVSSMANGKNELKEKLQQWGLPDSGITGAGETQDGQMGSEEKKVTVENTAAGIRLTMQNLSFKADSAELLPGEDKRLDQIADLLKLVPEQMFLVEGHTASVGNPSGEKKLSVDRADSVINQLAKRGIARERFICKGSGGTKPVADNSTREGKARNRRVEITILE